MNQQSAYLVKKAISELEIAQAQRFQIDNPIFMGHIATAKSALESALALPEPTPDRRHMPPSHIGTGW